MDIEKRLEESGWFLRSLPEEERSYARCLIAVSASGKQFNCCESILCEIPIAFRTAEICTAAIMNNGDALRDVPLDLRSYELCREAVTRWGEALGDVPSHMRDESLCIAAVEEYGMAIIYVPHQYWNESLALLAVKTAPRALSVLPEKLKTLAVCRVALREPLTFSTIIDYVPKELICQLLR